MFAHSFPNCLGGVAVYARARVPNVATAPKAMPKITEGAANMNDEANAKIGWCVIEKLTARQPF